MNHAQLSKNFDALPDMAYIDNSDARVPGAALILCIKRGESGFQAVTTTSSAASLNKALGVTQAQAEAMFIGSMFGWDVEGAHPDMHVDKNHHYLSTVLVDKTTHKTTKGDG